MATLNIITAQDVIDSLALQSATEVTAAINKLLPSATHFFQAVLGTVFEENLARADIFYLDDERYPALPDNMFRLRLKQAFARTGTVSLKYASSRSGVLDTASAQDIPATDYNVDLVKGLVFVDDIDMKQDRPAGTTYRKQYVKVVYDAGFSTDLTTIPPPDWLKQAILAWMPSVLIQKPDDVDKSIKVALQIRAIAAEMVAPYKRETAFNYAPIY